MSDSFDYRSLMPTIPWRLCKDGQPAAGYEETYIVSVYSPETNKVQTCIGKYTAAGEYPSDTEPQNAWMVLTDLAIGEAMEEMCNHSEWDPPFLFNSQVIAWSPLPRPFTGEKS